MKALLACMIGCSSIAAFAQTSMNGIMQGPGYIPSAPSSAFSGRPGGAETPTMRQQKLQRAIALRAEAASLLKQDHGELTPAHETYIRRKACGILGSNRMETGTAVRTRRCGA